MEVRPATPADFPALERLIIASFEAVTWARSLEERYGLLNGLDWRARWQRRVAKIFAEQIVLAGEAGGELVAAATATLDRDAALGYIDVLAVGVGCQHKGYGREMLRGAMRHLQGLGAQYVNLDCLTTNEKANELYRSEGFEEVARHIRWFRRL
jgi:ribosomal protein S18 acetylase RimI-like enzyme